MKEYGINPDLVVSLEMRDELVYDKLEGRRFDPLHQRYYDIIHQPNIPTSTIDRLVHAEEDKHPNVKRRLLEYKET